MGPFRILLVEDEAVIRELVRHMLTEEGVVVECAATGIEGLKLAHAQAFHLCLLDVIVPGMDGLTLCRLLKAEPRTQALPVYMLTAMAKKADVEAASRAGADGYIHKPFRGDELSELVQRIRAQTPL